MARQYCGGQLGKQDNCQVVVSLSVANDHASLPIAYRLYLPETWAEDPARRVKAGVPEEVDFATKTAIALGQIRQALADSAPIGTVLGDAGYGDECDFRVGVAELGLRYVLGIRSTTSVWSRPGAAATRALVRPRPAANPAAPQPGAPAGVGQGSGREPAGTDLAARDLA